MNRISQVITDRTLKLCDSRIYMVQRSVHGLSLLSTPPHDFCAQSAICVCRSLTINAVAGLFFFGLFNGLFDASEVTVLGSSADVIERDIKGSEKPLRSDGRPGTQLDEVSMPPTSEESKLSAGGLRCARRNSARVEPGMRMLSDCAAREPRTELAGSESSSGDTAGGERRSIRRLPNSRGEREDERERGDTSTKAPTDVLWAVVENRTEGEDVDMKAARRPRVVR